MPDQELHRIASSNNSSETASLENNWHCVTVSHGGTWSHNVISSGAGDVSTELYQMVPHVSNLWTQQMRYATCQTLPSDQNRDIDRLCFAHTHISSGGRSILVFLHALALSLLCTPYVTPLRAVSKGRGISCVETCFQRRPWFTKKSRLARKVVLSPSSVQPRPHNDFVLAFYRFVDLSLIGTIRPIRRLL